MRVGIRLAMVLVAVCVAAVGVRFVRRPSAAPVGQIASTPSAGSSSLPITSGIFLPLVCEPALGDLRFVDPVQAVPLPDSSGGIVVVERTGRLQLVDPSTRPPETSVLLDLTAKLQLTPDQAEEGLLSLTFHPQFNQPQSPHRGELFVYYTAKSDRGPSNRLSRFRMVGRASQPVSGATGWEVRPTIDPASEEILLDQPDEKQAHNGGGLAFGPDGFLYLGVGDDAPPQPNPNAQVITNGLFSGILRIDVDCRGGTVSRPPAKRLTTSSTTPVESAPYSIPRDNPFLHVPGAREEFFAIGLRNPWRLSFDALTGRLFVADPGDRRREEINVVEAGSNCGWAYAEGTLRTADFDQQAVHRPQPYVGRETWPIFEYPRDAAHRCVIGGHVYRGSQFPELFGRYVYADQSGRIYALQLGGDGRTVHGQELLAVVPDVVIGVSSLDLDADGELLISTIGELGRESGIVFRLRRTVPSEQAPMPPTLAAAGLFDDWRALKPKEEFVGYDVNVPLWSDGAAKRRWIAVPAGQPVELLSEGKFRYPAGTIFVKHFELATDERQPGKLRPLETRVLVVDERHEVYGLTYRWSADGKRTRPVSRSEQETIEIIQADGTKRQQVWHYPGRFDCLMCHNDSAGYVLGFVPKQLAGKGSGVRVQGSEVRGQDSVAGDQIAELIARGVVRRCDPPGEAMPIAPLVSLDDHTAPLVERVRSYLDVNCSMCHNPGRRFAAFDTRVERLLPEQGIVEGHSYHHSDLGKDVRIVKPGDLTHSMLYRRLTSPEPHLRMPPLGSTVVDGQAASLVAEWITALQDGAEIATRPKPPRE